MRRAVASVLQTLSAQSWDRGLKYLPRNQRQNINGRRVHRLAQLMVSKSIGEMYLSLMSQWQLEEGVVL
jgi:asparagine synthase (glutamine-hydrolysing)